MQKDTEIIKGYLQVGSDGTGNAVINHPDIQPDANGAGHIIFSPSQARALARLLSKHAMEADGERKNRKEATK